MSQASTADAANLRTDDFDYELPPHLIAQTPLPERDAARLLVVDRRTGQLHHSAIRALASWLDPGDLLVANNSRVIPARLSAWRPDTGGRVELLLLRETEPGIWTALARPARRLRIGTPLLIQPRAQVVASPVPAEVVGRGDEGQVTIAVGEGFGSRLAAYGNAPLPPYIGVPLADDERYQTVYASAPGSAAAPTAGLHFTEALLADLRAGGIGWTEVTLHVGLDTFRPVVVDRVADHRIHREWCTVPAAAASAIADARAAAKRVVAVGTTAARTLETYGATEAFHDRAPFAGWTGLFIVPGYRWRVVDALLTNFHLPRSTLLMMVSSFAGVELIRRAYAAAIDAGYRFYSFGDAMLIR